MDGSGDEGEVVVVLKREREEAARGIWTLRRRWSQSMSSSRIRTVSRPEERNLVLVSWFTDKVSAKGIQTIRARGDGSSRRISCPSSFLWEGLRFGIVLRLPRSILVDLGW